MFKIAASPDYWAKVEVPFRTESGKEQIQKFECKFRRVTQAELEEFMEQGRAGRLRDAAVLDQVWLDWRGVADESGEDLPFNGSNRERLCQIVPVQACVVKAFFDTIGTARLGN